VKSVGTDVSVVDVVRDARLLPTLAIALSVQPAREKQHLRRSDRLFDIHLRSEHCRRIHLREM